MAHSHAVPQGGHHLILFRVPRRGLRFFFLVVACMSAAAMLLALAPPVRAAAQAISTAIPPVILDKAPAHIDLWPHLGLLSDPDKSFRIEEVLAKKAGFHAPKSAYATLGMRHDAVWLRMVVAASHQAHDAWVLNFDYALLNRIDVYVVNDGEVSAQYRLGNAVPEMSRPIAGRTHAVAIDFAPDRETEIYVRVESIGAKILPVSLARLTDFHDRALAEQTVQGALASLALFLVVYSLLRWASLRESLYAKYALLVSASALFSVHFFGLGEQYIWTDIDWIERRLAGITSLTAAGATALFILDVMHTDISPRLRIALRAVATLLFSCALLHALDILSIRHVGYVMSSFGLVPALLGLPAAIARQRRGDTTGGYFILAWIGYFIASAIMVGVVRGQIGVSFWTIHSFQIGATLDMLIFLRIALLRSERVHEAAERANLERDSLLNMAHTDPLTGLLNRRGLSAALEGALAGADEHHAIAVYILDLDGFKPVNDQHGHDVGDELLIATAARLKSGVRGNDAVARLGGDEFVIMSPGFATTQQAHELGQKLLEAFQKPFAVRGNEFRIGVTIGYALAPLDGNNAIALMKYADAALYTGKHEGKNCLRRAVSDKH